MVMRIHCRYKLSQISQVVSVLKITPLYLPHNADFSNFTEEKTEAQDI